jgi:mono/diheme cytochrome c family protein
MSICRSVHWFRHCVAFAISQLLSVSFCAAQASGNALASGKALNPNPARAKSDYILYCAGCHGFEGAPVKLGRIPPLKDSIADFLKVEGGRAYLVQVPGVNNTSMSDERIAGVINWVLKEFGSTTLKIEFQIYTAAEVASYRASRPVDITMRRRELLERLASLGIRKD